MTSGRFDGQRLLITGSSGYFGRELTHAFVREGACVTLLDRQPPAPGDLESWGSKTRFLHSDLSQPEKLASVIEAISDDELPTLLVNNAAIFPFADILEADIGLCRSIFDINVLAPLALARGLAKRWIGLSRPGNIVNVSSAAAEVARGNGAIYGPSKAALEQMTRILAIELAKFGIRVNAVRPGLADDPHNPHIPQDHLKRLSSALPLGRLIAPGEFAQVVMFLCSDQSAYMTGSVLNCDGGGGINRRAPAV